MSLSETIHNAFDKLKAFLNEETHELAEHVAPVAKELAALAASHLKDVAAAVSAIVVQGILEKKDPEAIKADALNAVKVNFKVEANEALHDAAKAVALAVVNAHIDVVPDYKTHINN